MHQEDGYTSTEEGERISYLYVEYLRIGAEQFLADCVWLELKLVAAGIDPILVIPLSVLIFVVLSIRNRDIRFMILASIGANIGSPRHFCYQKA